MIKKNDEIELEIESVSSEGSGVAHADGLTVFVDGAVAGDTVLAHIIKSKSNYAVGKIVNIISPSKHRIPVDCLSYERCGGCCFRHVEYAHQLEMKKQIVNDAFRHIAGMEVEVDGIMTAECYNYRNKGIYHIGKDNSGKMIAGFYSHRSHRLVDCMGCLLAPKEFESILKVILAHAEKHGITIYDEKSHSGLLRSVFIRKAFSTGEIMVCPVINGKGYPQLRSFIDEVRQACPDISSIALNFNLENTNAALGRKIRTVFGNEFITDELCSMKFNISPLSFFQVNPLCAQKLYEKAKEFAALKGNETLLDLYCGTGSIGLSMAADCKRLIGVEIVADAIENAKENARINNISNAEFICADAFEAAKLLTEQGTAPDCIILDPPRKGCSEQTVRLCAEMQPSRIVYVSCDPATLARDCRHFDELGYKVIKATAADMFPWTRHVETVVLMSRVKG